MSRDPESIRLEKDARRSENWKRWGPYLSERQWGTVREDYSPRGDAWDYFPHEHARSRAYRWGEDGLLGICDRQGRLCFALAVWNERDAILKERLFGLTGPEGNHGEDVKELYYYLDATPTSSYLKARYKYPHAPFPYEALLEENRRRGLDDREAELLDTGVFDEDRYFDVTAEYAKARDEDIFVRVTINNRGPEAAPFHLLGTLWFRNTWSWGREGEGYWPKPSLVRLDDNRVRAEHASLGRFVFVAEDPDALLFTGNETNLERLFETPNEAPYVKDAFHRHVIDGEEGAVDPSGEGTKAAAWRRLEIGPGERRVVCFRLVAERYHDGLGLTNAEDVFTRRIAEADRFYAKRIPGPLDAEETRVARQAYAGLLWTKQFYYYVVEQWFEGDPAQPEPPDRPKRNRGWTHLYNRDVISMPDKWEYPWYAAWDLAFHMLPFAQVDPAFAKSQLILMLREWYMHPNGQIPAYEFQLSDVNPPVHAWAAWRVYKMTGARGQRDRTFLARVFQKLLLNFTWWVNRKDENGDNLFSGGFLGLDNIGLFDRSHVIPGGGRLRQADGTAWMAFYCSTMLSMALELALEDPAYEDLASKFFEHFVAIVDAMNHLGGKGLWDPEDGFYYDQLLLPDGAVTLKTRSLVGIVPLFAVEVLEDDVISALPGFAKRMKWFLANREDLAGHITYLEHAGGQHGHRLLAVPSREKLERVLRYVFDEAEFLSPYGIRSLSRFHAENPYTLEVSGEHFDVAYWSGESRSWMFGGNSNWRGPVWLPMNYLLIEALQRYHHFYGDEFKVEYPSGTGRYLDLRSIALDLSRRLTALFVPGKDGSRPCHGGDALYRERPEFEDLILFYEYFDGDDGRGLGASHQTGWTALVTRCLDHLARSRSGDTTDSLPKM
ncbi:MAG: glucosidase [Deltaproteobacteria bacterium]